MTGRKRTLTIGDRTVIAHLSPAFDDALAELVCLIAILPKEQESQLYERAATAFMQIAEDTPAAVAGTTEAYLLHAPPNMLALIDELRIAADRHLAAMHRQTLSTTNEETKGHHHEDADAS